MACMFRVCIVIAYLNAPHCCDGNADYPYNENDTLSDDEKCLLTMCMPPYYNIVCLV